MTRRVRPLPQAGRNAGWALMGLAVAGCTSLPPDTNEPSALVPLARWQALDAPGAAAATPTERAAWWQAFGDAELSRWIQRAQQGSPRVAAAEAAWRQAAAQRDAAAAAQSPTLGATASAGRDGSGQGDTRRSGERFQLGLDARWVPDVFGAARRALAAADAAVRRASSTATGEMAPDQLRVATTKLADARAAIARGDTERGLRLAEQATVDAQVAELHAQAQRARQAATESEAAARALREELNRKAVR